MGKLTFQFQMNCESSVMRSADSDDWESADSDDWESADSDNWESTDSDNCDDCEIIVGGLCADCHDWELIATIVS
jgi:hypothetical protein